MFNKILLVAGDDNRPEELDLLHERGYVVHTLRDVIEHLRALNLVQNESNVRQAITLVLCEVHAVVLHHDLQAAEVLFYKEKCFWDGKHCIMLGALPLFPPERQHAFDAANLWNGRVEAELCETTDERAWRQVAVARIRSVIASAKEAWLRFERDFNARHGWFFTNGRKQRINTAVPMEVHYGEDTVLSTTG